MSRAFLPHLLLMALGYVLAVLVSVTIATLIMGLQTALPGKVNWGSFYSFWRDFPNLLFLGGLTITALYGLPGWLIFVFTAELRREKRRFWFAAAGVLTALLALFLAGKGHIPLTMPAMVIGSLIGGFFGGLAYWAAAGRGSGGWRAPLGARADETAMDGGALK